MATVRIELDNRGTSYTCLDNVTGRVILNLSSEETISSITVKMEGISRTRLPAPKDHDGNRETRKRSEVEIHRLLYLVETVFPAPEIREQTSPSNSGFTVRAGQYEYPFKIRIPLNSSCGDDPSVGGLMNRLSFEKGSLEYAKDAAKHIRATLPPSLSGIPEDEALIKYFLKATVNRPQFYRANMRFEEPFVFLPIEPPRPPPTPKETFAKRSHSIAYQPPSPAHSKKRGIFGVFRSHSPPPPPPPPQLIQFSIEARLPSPPIVVPNYPIPFRILLVKHSPYYTPVFVRGIQIDLHAFTEIHAHGIMKTVQKCIPVLCLAGLAVPIGAEDSEVGKELEADNFMWKMASLPDTVPPSFRTCNIWRTYQLEITIGLSYGMVGPVENIPLTMPIQVYSGISPPQKLIDAALHSDPPRLPPRTCSGQTLKGQMTLTVPAPIAGGSHSAKNSPVSSPVSPSFPKRPHSSNGAPQWPSNAPAVSRPGNSTGGDEAAPPTYEDALADDIGPVDGPRRRYEQEGGYYGALPDDVQS